MVISWTAVAGWLIGGLIVGAVKEYCKAKWGKRRK